MADRIPYAGNIPLYGRPKIPNPRGGISTVDSVGMNIDGKETLLPLADDGRINDESRALLKYLRTGKHLGRYDTVEEGKAAAEQIHNDYEAGRYEDWAKPLASHKQALREVLSTRMLPHGR